MSPPSMLCTLVPNVPVTEIKGRQIGKDEAKLGCSQITWEELKELKTEIKNENLLELTSDDGESAEAKANNQKSDAATGFCQGC